MYLSPVCIRSVKKNEKCLGEKKLRERKLFSGDRIVVARSWKGEKNTAEMEKLGTTFEEARDLGAVSGWLVASLERGNRFICQC